MDVDFLYLIFYEVLLVTSACPDFGCSHWLDGVFLSSTPGGLSGDYSQDTLAVVNTIKLALEMPEDSPTKAQAQAEARQRINDFTATGGILLSPPLIPSLRCERR